MKIAVDMGHCPKSTGANGYLNELVEDRKIGAALIKELKARGHEVVDVTPADHAGEWLTGRANRANAAGVDFFVSIHLNAGGGTGTEVLTTSNSGAKAIAARTSATVAKALGLRDRGRKDRNNVTVIKATKMPAMRVEVCFVDTKQDAEAYWKLGAEGVALAIANGIDGTNASKTSVSTTVSNKVESVVKPAASNKASSYDDTPDDVREVQTYMNKKYNSGLAVDGDFGRLTKAAIVKEVQKLIGTSADGIFGKNSKAAWGSRCVKKGSKGELVRLVQMMLICRGYSIGSAGSDADCGAKTVAAIKRYQQKNGLSADGICGKNTAAKLFA